MLPSTLVQRQRRQCLIKKILKAQNESGELASEAVVNHRIITAFCFQEKVLKLLELTQVSSKKESYGQSWYAGFGLFLSQFITGAIPALTFWYGGRLLYHKEITYEHLFQTFLIVVTTGRLIAETGTISADPIKRYQCTGVSFQDSEKKDQNRP